MGDLDDYQRQAHETAVYPPSHGQTYLALGLANEAGEVAGVLKKYLRGDYGPVGGDESLNRCRELIGHELGDVLWYLAECASMWGWPLNTIAQMNLDRLADRRERNQLRGSGDRR